MKKKKKKMRKSGDFERIQSTTSARNLTPLIFLLESWAPHSVFGKLKVQVKCGEYK
ncbi:hypothetical protein HanIR_Chr12g0585421 [Helianthus annuus]|nr:hypothetical protein HanIR_Chr12g0585421 [Helianthus annuus]